MVVLMNEPLYQFNQQNPFSSNKSILIIKHCIIGIVICILEIAGICLKEGQVLVTWMVSMVTLMVSMVTWIVSMITWMVSISDPLAWDESDVGKCQMALILIFCSKWLL